MADKREIQLSITGKETVSPAAKKAGEAVENLGDDFQETARAAEKLDREIEDANQALRGLAAAYAAAETAADRADLSKQIRKAKKDLRELASTRGILGDVGKAGGEVIKDLAKVGAKGGVAAGKAASEGFAAAFKAMPPQAQAAVGAVIVGGILASSSAIGAATTAAILSGVGAAGIGSGLAAAMQDPAVERQAQLTARRLSDAFIEGGKAWVGPALESLREIEDGGAEIIEQWSKASAQLAPDLVGLAKSLTQMGKNAMPGVAEAMKAARPLIEVIRRELPQVGDAISSFLTSISEDTDGAVMALQALFDTAEIVIIGTGKAIAFLSREFEGMVRILAEAHDRLGPFAALLSPLAPVAAELRDRLNETSAATKETGDAADSAAPQVGTLAERQELLNAELGEGIELAGSFAELVDRISGAALSAQDAEVRWQETIDKATEAIKKNGQTLDADTEKGRANLTILSEMVRVGKERAQSIYDQTAATVGTTQAEALAAQSYMHSRDQLIQTRIAMGDSRAAAVEYANTVMAVPKEWPTYLSLQNVPQATESIQKYKAFLDSIPREVYTYFTTIGQGASQGFGSAPGRAGGGPVEAGRVYKVGERGEELFMPDADGTIIPADQTRRLMASGASSGMGARASAPVGRPVLEVRGERAIVELLRKLIKNYDIVPG